MSLEDAQEKYLKRITKYTKGKNRASKRFESMERFIPQQVIKPFKRARAVLQYSKKGDFIARFPSTTTAGRAVGVSQSQISACAGGRIKTSGGFVWKYE